MSKRKNASLVLLAYSDSEHEDDNFEDESQADSESNEVIENELLDETQTNIDQNENEEKETLDLYFEDVFGDRQLSILEFHQSLLNKTVDEIMIPPVTKIPCPPELQLQIENLYEKVSNGYDLNKAIQKRKSMRNPSIYEKMISYCQINEMATNYPKEIYNPEPFLTENSYYEELSKAQKDEMEKREKEKKEIDKSNNKQKTNSGLPEKKSKWDSATSTSTIVNHSAAMAAALVAANKVKQLTNLTKPTVISAFGTIAKKK